MRLTIVLAAVLVVPLTALAAPGVHDFKAVAIAPDGSDSDVPQLLVIRDLKGGAVTVKLPCTAGPDCEVSSPSWSRDGRLAFLVSRPKDGVTDIETADIATGNAQRALSFEG